MQAVLLLARNHAGICPSIEPQPRLVWSPSTHAAATCHATTHRHGLLLPGPHAVVPSWGKKMFCKITHG
uniref:Uncharacterized protein n=1 Tax=Aegilops tauschii subsp. strangulata TaxID=200361 RepID=A0A453K4X9_AEGTS